MRSAAERNTRKILVADDDPSHLELLSARLEREGYEVRAASNGEEALEMAEADPPDLILLDIMMPKLDGYSLLLRLNGNDRTCRIPVFIVSGQLEAEHEEIYRTFGAREFIRKPYKLADLAGRVRNVLS